MALLMGGALGAASIYFVARSSPGETRLVEGQPISYWVRCLESDDESLREKAVVNLPKYGADAVYKVMPMLESGMAQDGAVEVMFKIGAPAVRPLIDVLAVGSTHMRIGAIRALNRMGPKLAAPAVSEVSKLLNDDSTGPVAAQF